MFRSPHLLLPVALLISTVACTDSHANLGEAYVAPSSLRLRTELQSKTANGVTLKHGDHLQIVDVQRRMVLVRTEKGFQGWVDSLQLLSPQQMDQLKSRRQQQAAMPPQGFATAYEVLNVHIDPERQSPAFAQIPEGGSVSILGRTITPRLPPSSRTSSLVITKPQPLSHKQRREQQNKSTSFRLPPRPPAPKPPQNWLQLSAERIDGDSSEPEVPKPALVVPARSQPAEKAPVLDSWTLIRTSHNESGWVLTRNLLMSIPDDVAQYAEGKQITAFFDLGLIHDDVKGSRHNWLWTTAARALPYDFDSWRVFLWNTRRHRYETSYRQHDVEGHFPVHVEPAEAGSPLRTFELITKDEDGKTRRRRYTFDGHLVRLANTEDFNPTLESTNLPVPSIDTKNLGKTGWLKRQWLSLRQRIAR